MAFQQRKWVQTWWEQFQTDHLQQQNQTRNFLDLAASSLSFLLALLCSNFAESNSDHQSDRNTENSDYFRDPASPTNCCICKTEWAVNSRTGARTSGLGQELAQALLPEKTHYTTPKKATEEAAFIRDLNPPCKPSVTKSTFYHNLHEVCNPDFSCTIKQWPITLSYPKASWRINLEI